MHTNKNVTLLTIKFLFSGLCLSPEIMSVEKHRPGTTRGVFPECSLRMWRTERHSVIKDWAHTWYWKSHSHL